MEEFKLHFDPPHLSQRKIHKILAIKKYDEEIAKGATEDRALRSANIYANKYTVECWQRQETGNLRNVYNPEGWK